MRKINVDLIYENHAAIVLFYLARAIILSCLCIAIVLVRLISKYIQGVWVFIAIQGWWKPLKICCADYLEHDRCPSSNSGCPAKRQVPHGIRAKGMAAFYLIRAFLILHNGHHWENTMTLVKTYWLILADSWGILGNTILLPWRPQAFGEGEWYCPLSLRTKTVFPNMFLPEPQSLSMMATVQDQKCSN